jgi:high-affinity iron transporter
MKILSRFIFLFVVFNLSTAFAMEASPRSLVHLLDYLAQDYGGAVQNGKVISKDEYAEQVEFATTVIKITGELQNQGLLKEIKEETTQLNTLIKNKADAKKVSELALKLKSDVIRLANLDTAPLRWPDIQKGEALFKNTCVTCHGQEGRGDGPAGKGLNPAPTNFHDGERLSQISPFQAFNTIRLGVQGTGMVGFTNYTDDEIWSLAFYVVSLRHKILQPEDASAQQKVLEEALTEVSLEDVANTTDANLLKKFTNLKDVTPSAALAVTRLFSASENKQAFLSVAIKDLREASVLYKQGAVAQARQKALSAYLEGTLVPMIGMTLVNFAYFNWWYAPLGYTLVGFVDGLVGWVLASLVMKPAKGA